MGKFFNNGSMTTKFHIQNEQEGLGGQKMRHLGTEKFAEIY